MDYPSVFVCLMGMGTVFFGLVCLIVLTTIMSKLVGRDAPAAAVAAPAAPVPAANQQELVAAISAAIAEELGTDISGLRIVSMKKL